MPQIELTELQIKKLNKLLEDADKIHAIVDEEDHRTWLAKRVFRISAFLAAMVGGWVALSEIWKKVEILLHVSNGPK